jgi:hypothetical protein
MTASPDTLMQVFLQRADIGHIALFCWAAGASALVAFTIREAADAARRSDSFMQEFLHELSRFNRSLEEDVE